MKETNYEERAAMVMAREALKIAIDQCSFRWLFCWTDGLTTEQQSCFDCACCISYNDIKGCGCKCHERIRELDRLLAASLTSMLEHSKMWCWDRDITGKQREERKNVDS